MKKHYSSEEEFLKNYDSSNFEKLSMTTDILIMSVSTEEGKGHRPSALFKYIKHS